jgi:hypothetical protein
MRSEEDIVRVKIELTADIELDMQRMVEDDPVWLQISHGAELDDPLQRQEAFRLYLSHYIVRERFLSGMPSTNGPGSMRLNKMEVSFYGDHSNSTQSGNDNTAAGVVAESTE